MKYIKIFILIVLVNTHPMTKKHTSWPARKTTCHQRKIFYFLTYPTSLTLADMNKPITRTMADLSLLCIESFLFPTQAEAKYKMDEHSNDFRIPVTGISHTTPHQGHITPAMILEIRSLVKCSIIQRQKLAKAQAKQEKEEELLQKYRDAFADAYFGGSLPPPDEIENEKICYYR